MKILISKLFSSRFLITLLVCLPAFCFAQKSNIPPFELIYTNRVPDHANILGCSPPANPSQNLVYNPGFATNGNYNGNWVNPFAFDFVDYWTNTHGTPNFDFPPFEPPPFPGVHAAFGGSTYISGSNLITSEGEAGNITRLTPGKEYSLTFFLKTELGSTPQSPSHIVRLYLIHCEDVPVGIPDPNPAQSVVPPIPANNQPIFCETNSGNAFWHQLTVCFTANDDYNAIWAFPEVTPLTTTTDYTFYMGLGYPELISKTDFAINISNDPNDNCIKTLSPSYAVMNATYLWTLNGNFLSSSQTVQINTATQYGAVALQVTLPNGATNSTCTVQNPQCPILSPTINILPCSGCTPPVVSPVGPIDYWLFADAVPVINRVLTSSVASGNQWYYNGVAIPGATGQTYLMGSGYSSIGTGNYYVVNNGCISNSISVTFKLYGYGNYGEDVFDRLGAKVHPIQTSGYYCYNTSNNFIQQFNLGAGTNYQWNFKTYPSTGTQNITLTPGSYNPSSNQAAVDVAGPTPSLYTAVQGIADKNGAESIIEYNLYLSHPDFIATSQQVCAFAGQHIINWNGASPYSTLPGGSGFDYEQYDFGSGVIFAGPGAGNSTVTIPGRSTPQQMVVKFNAPTTVHKYFYYNWSFGGCYREDYNVTLYNGCKTEATFINSGIYPNPATNQITVTATNATIQSVEIVSLFGPTVKRVIANNEKNAIVNVAALSPGIYNCKIITNKGIEYQRLVIRRQ